MPEPTPPEEIAKRQETYAEQAANLANWIAKREANFERPDLRNTQDETDIEGFSGALITTIQRIEEGYVTGRFDRCGYGYVEDYVHAMKVLLHKASDLEGCAEDVA